MGCLPSSLQLNDLDYEAMGYELMSKPPADTPQEPPKPHATIALTDEQLKCFEWAKNQDHWKKYTRNKKSFLTCFNNTVEGGLKDQWLATLLPKSKATPREKTIYGVAISEIERLARAGEKYEQTAARINREREEAKMPKNSQN